MEIPMVYSYLIFQVQILTISNLNKDNIITCKNVTIINENNIINELNFNNFINKLLFC